MIEISIMGNGEKQRKNVSVKVALANVHLQRLWNAVMPWPLTIAVVGTITAYILLVRSVRFKRVNSIAFKFTEDELQCMTPYTAQKIVHEAFLYDTPMTMLLGTQVALFKVYGISSIASILLKTGVLTSSTQMNKRLADTSVLVATALSNPIIGPGSGCPAMAAREVLDPRGALAIARMNYLHGKYPIKNDDFLYNLSLFMIEPIKRTAMFDWRPHSPLEVQAIFVLWTEIGRRMGIKNIWKTYDEMVEWSIQYETENMVPTEASQELARTTIAHFMSRVPSIFGLRTAAYQLVLTILDHRTRTAMGLPDPHPRSVAIAHHLFQLRAFIVRNFCLPRKRPALWVRLDSFHLIDEKGVARIPAVYKRRSGPWYYPEERGWALIKQRIKIALGLQDPFKIPGKNWKCEGYRIEEIGPLRFEELGHEEVVREAGRIQGCPVTGIWGPPSNHPSSLPGMKTGCGD